MSNTARLTATATVQAQRGKLAGFYVNSTTTGTLVLYDGTSASGDQITGTVTPAVGWHKFPVRFDRGLHAVIGGSALDVTFVFE